MSVTKHPTIITPLGSCTHVWVAEKDTKFANEGQSPKYKCTVLMPKDSMQPGRTDNGKTTLDGDAWITELLRHAGANGGSSVPGKKGCPIRDGDGWTDKNGVQKEETVGMWCMTAQTAYEFEMIDSNGAQLVDRTAVENGDKVRIAIQPASGDFNGVPYYSLRMKIVQLVEKSGMGRSGANMFATFDDEDGYQAEAPKPVAKALASFEDDIPDFAPSVTNGDF